MSDRGASDTRTGGPSSRFLGPVRGRWWRVAGLLGAMVAIMIVAMLVARPDDGGQRWVSGMDPATHPDAVAGLDSQPVPGSDSMSPAGDTEDAGDPASASRPGGSGAGSGDDASGGGSGPGAQTGEPVTPVTEPPPTASQPSAPDEPVGMLDSVFGESMFPETYPGVKLVLAFDVDDSEVTATYKSEGRELFDIVRVTVQQTESEAAALAAAEKTLAYYGPERTTYTWGGREITQALGVLGDPDGESALGFVWRQGSYCVDVTVFPPYKEDVAAGRQAALGFIGRLGY